jgi:hypothetical protein
MKVVIRLPFTLRFERLNTHGQITPSAFSRSSSALLSLQELLEAVGEREGSPLVVLRRVRVQADDAGFEVDVPPLELQNLARDPPARDIGEPHRWTDGRRQASEDALDLLALEDPLGVRALQHRERVRPRGGETRRNTLDRQLLRRDEEYPCSHGLERPRTELVPRFND